MKLRHHLTSTLALLLLTCASLHAAPLLRDFGLRGAIAGDNVRFELDLGYTGLARGEGIELLRGEVALIEATLPKRAELRRDGDALRLVR
ncbi:MAG: hypothetical protein PHR35_19845, partial [Kiritimatiellae bacterium]|nr:hypothetical protein [Kiritimatiellia bacterium]